MWTTAELLHAVSIGMLILTVGAVLKDHRQDPSARAYIALAVTLICHLIFPSLLSRGAPRAISRIVLLGNAGGAAAFWILAKVHFDDELHLRPVHLALLVPQVGAAVTSYLIAENRGAEIQSDPLYLMCRMLALPVFAHALYTIYVGARSDLVLSRLKLRYGLLAATGLYAITEIVAKTILMSAASTPAARVVHAATLMVLIAVLSVLSIRIRLEVLRPAFGPLPTRAGVDPALAEALRQLLDVEEIFRQEGLTIGALARRLNVQEQQVRQLVNTQLGFRNFNAFLHHYRIRAAQRALADPEKREQSVAEIAFEVGYQSLGPFNKAFKEITQRTPTDFRAAPPSAAELP